MTFAPSPSSLRLCVLESATPELVPPRRRLRVAREVMRAALVPIGGPIAVALVDDERADVIAARIDLADLRRAVREILIADDAVRRRFVELDRHADRKRLVALELEPAHLFEDAEVFTVTDDGDLDVAGGARAALLRGRVGGRRLLGLGHRRAHQVIALEAAEVAGVLVLERDLHDEEH